MAYSDRCKAAWMRLAELCTISRKSRKQESTIESKRQPTNGPPRFRRNFSDESKLRGVSDFAEMKR
jgi:hypothetical protein